SRMLSTADCSVSGGFSSGIRWNPSRPQVPWLMSVLATPWPINGETGAPFISQQKCCMNSDDQQSAAPMARTAGLHVRARQGRSPDRHARRQECGLPVHGSAKELKKGTVLAIKKALGLR